MIKFTRLKLPIVIIFYTLLSAILLINCKREVYCTVTFKTDDDTVYITQSVKEGDVVAPPNNPQREGYSFIAWYLGDEAYDFSSSVDKDFTLVARWNKNPIFYTVTFLDFDGFEFKTCQVKEGELVERPENPLKQDYEFSFWSLNGVEFDFFNPITSNLTLNSNWKEKEKNKYTVSFNTGGAGSIDSQLVTEGECAVEPNAPEKNDFNFDGWLLNGEKFDFTTPITENLQLVASWIEEIVYHTVNFYSDGVLVCSKRVENGEVVEGVPMGNLEESEFVCWTKEGEEYDFSLPVIEDIDLIAKWKDIQNKKFTVKLLLNNGEGELSYQIEENGLVCKPEDPIKEGYLFDGWYLDGEKYDFSQPVTGSFVLNAVYLEKVSPIGFVGSWVGVENYEGINYIVELIICSDGNHILSFSDETETFLTVYSVKEIFIANAKLYVVFEIGSLEKTVIFDCDENQLASQSGVVGGEIILLGT